MAMKQIYPNAGLGGWLGRLTLGDLFYRLYVNDYSPTKNSLLSNFTEASFPGYAPQVVDPLSWTIIGVAGDVANMIAVAPSFENTGGIDVPLYGYFVTDFTVNYPLIAARFDAAPLIVRAGDFFPVPAAIAAFSKFTS